MVSGKDGEELTVVSRTASEIENGFKVVLCIIPFTVHTPFQYCIVLYCRFI
jgi:hypothetical protein